MDITDVEIIEAHVVRRGGEIDGEEEHHLLAVGAVTGDVDYADWPA